MRASIAEIARAVQNRVCRRPFVALHGGHQRRLGVGNRPDRLGTEAGAVDHATHFDDVIVREPVDRAAIRHVQARVDPASVSSASITSSATPAYPSPFSPSFRPFPPGSA